MAPEWRSGLARYGLAVGIFVVVAGIALLLHRYSIQLNLSILVGAGLAVAAWYAGRGPGLALLGMIVVFTAAMSPIPEGASLGSVVFTYVSAGAVFGGLVWLISGRRIAERRLRRQRELLHTTLASIGDGVIATDENGRITFVNGTAAKLIGCREDGPIGRPLGEVYRIVEDESGEPIVDVFERVRSGREKISFAVNVSLDCGEERRLPVMDSAAPILADDGQFLGAVVVFQDDRPRREAEREAKEAEARRQRSQKLEAVGRLTGGIAHDFNNLLTAMIGYTELALRKVPPDSKAREYLLNVESAGERAADLTRQLLAFSRQQRIETRTVDLNASIAEMMRLLGRVIGENIQVELKTAPELHTISADPSQIEQVIMNLALNARDAMPEGGRLIVETRNAHLDERFCGQFPDCVPGEYAEVLVSDTGYGMEPETLQRAFEPFFTTKPAGAGTGLGLSIAHGIVKQHGGQISAYSEPGKGTTIKFFLPAAAEGRPADACAAEQLRGGSETVLLADDDESLRELAGEVLGSLGYTVLTAKNGEAAVDLYLQEKDRIDLLLLDVVMPVLGGIDAYREIRRTGSEPPVIFASGYSSEMVGATADTSGINFSMIPVIQKPYTLEALGKVVRETLDILGSGDALDNSRGRSASQAL